MKRYRKLFCMLLMFMYVLTCFNSGLGFMGMQNSIVYAQSGQTEALWIPRDSGTNQTINDVVYGSGLFVAVGNGGTILTSSDGREWTSQNTGVTTNLKEIVYSGSLFVTAGVSGTILTSVDGISWTKRTSGTSKDLNAIAYGNGTFVIASSPEQNYRTSILRSNDGITWAKMSIDGYGLAQYTNTYRAEYLDGNFYVAGSQGNFNFSTDSTATSWSNNMRDSRAGGSIGNAACGNGFYVVSISDSIDRHFLSIDNGASVTLENTAGGRFIRFLDDKFYFGCIDGKIKVGTTTAGAIEWQEANTPETTSDISDITYAGGRFYAVGTQGFIMESLDGQNWVTVDSSTTDNLTKLVHSDSVITAVGSNGTICTKSLDGTIKDADIVALDKNWLTEDDILGANLSANNVTEDLNLLTAGEYGSTISWSSDRPDIISSDGKVTRPPYSGTNAVVTLTAMVTKGMSTVTKDFTVTVIEQEEAGLGDAAAVEADIAVLELVFAEGDSSNSVTQHIEELPAFGANGTTITWVSSNTDILSNDGQILDRSACGDSDVLLTLTATVSRGVASDTKEFPLLIKKLEKTDEQLVAEDIAVLELVFAEGDSSDSVTQPIEELPAFGANGTTITWVSSNTDILSNDGQILDRSACGDSDVLLALTATVSRGEASDTKEFPLLIKKLEKTDEQLVAEDAAEIDIYSIINGNTHTQSITGDLNFPTEGQRGSTITWSSNNPAVISNEGRVTRPAYNIGNTAVTLTALITKGEAVAERVYVFTVIRKEQTDEEAVEAYLQIINDSHLLGENESLLNVAKNLTLPATGAFDTIISWSSSNPAVVSNTGIVTRPVYGSPNSQITLTATISKGAASRSKDFLVTVVEMPDTIAPSVASVEPADNETGVSTYSNVEIVFDENITLSSKADEIKLSYKKTKLSWFKIYTVDIYEEVSVSIDDNNPKMLIIDPSAKQLNGSTSYTLVLPTDAVCDMSGNSNSDQSLTFRTGFSDNTDPEFVSINPKDGETKVKADKIIEISFDENIYPSKKFSSIKLEASGKKVPCSITTSGSKVIMTPESPLEEDQKYTVILPYDSVEDRGGNKFSSLLSFIIDEKKYKFTTAAEFSEPKALNMFPMDGTENISTMSQLRIEFNENIIEGDTFEQIVLKDSSSKIIGANISISDKNITINPKNGLKKNTSYSIVIPKGSIKDKNENTLSDPIEYRFSTGNSGLQLVNTAPDSKDTEAPLNTSLMLTFNSDIYKGRNFGGIQLENSDGNNIGIRADLLQNGLFITPASPLTKGSRYYLKVPEGALKDSAENVNGALMYSFGTADDLDINWNSVGLARSIYPIEGHEVIFDASPLISKFEAAGRKILNYTWDFGDGNTAVGEKVSHTYSESNKDYNAALTISDNKGISYTRIISIHTMRDYGLYELEVSPGNVILPDAINNEEAVEIEYMAKVTKQGNNIPNDIVVAHLLDTNGEVLKVIIESTDSDGNAIFKIKKPDGYTAKVLNIKFIHFMNSKEVHRQIRFDQFADNVTIDFLIYDIDENTLLDPSRAGGLHVYVNGEPKVATKVYDISDRYVDLYKQVYSKEPPYKFRLENLRTGHQHIEIKDIPYHYDFDQKVIVRNTGTEVAMERFEVERFIPSDKPVVKRVTSDVSNSGGNEDSMVFKGVPVRYTITDNWAGHEPGFFQFVYEDKDGNRRVINTESAFFMQQVEIPDDCRDGSRVQVVACSADGTKSDPLDIKVKILPLPENGTAKIEDGGFVVSIGQSMPEVTTKVPKKDFPLLDGGTVGIDSDHFIAEGEMDEEGDLVLTIAKKSTATIGSAETEKVLGGKFKLRYNHDTDDWDFAGGGVIVSIDGSYSLESTFKVAIIPVTAKVTGSVKLESVLMMLKDFEKGDYDFEGEITLEPSIEAALGAGVDWLNVEGYLGGGLVGSITLPSGDMALIAKVEGGVRATAFCFEYEKGLLEYEWELASGNPFSGMRMQLPNEIANGDQLKLMDRDYLAEQSEWNGAEHPKGLAGTFSLNESFFANSVSNIIDKQLQSNVFPNTEQTLLNMGDKMIMAWVADNPDRSSINRAQIVYSVLENGLWSVPMPMVDDDTADFKPVISGVGGGALIAWQNVGRVLGDDVLSSFPDGSGDDENTDDLTHSSGIIEMVSALEIGVADMDPDLSGWRNCRNLTDDNYLDHSPRLASGGNSAILTWIKNEYNDLNGSADKPNKIMSSRWDGSGWTEPECISDNVGAIAGSSIAYDGTRGIYTFMVDEDGDRDTKMDQEIYALLYENGQWNSNPVRLTENEVEDANPAALILDNGIYLVWSHDGNIVYTDDIEQITIKTIPAVSNPGGMFKTAVSSTSEAALVYTETENGGQNIYTMLYDAPNDVWSEKIRLTDTEGSLASYVSPAFDNNGNIYAAYTSVDLYKKVVDGSEYTSLGDSDLHILTLYPKHDLAVAAEGIATLEENPVSEMTATITAEIMNEGEYTERNVEVGFYNGDPSNGGQKIGDTYVITQPIAPRTSAMAQMEWAIPETESIQDVYVVVDPGGKLYDADRENNIAHNSLVRADLVIAGMDYFQSVTDSDEDGESEGSGYMNFLLSTQVSNIGSIPVDNAVLALYENGIDGQIIESSTIDRLEPGETKTVQIVWDANGKPFENDRFTVAGNVSAQGVAEYSLDNNEYHKSVKVRTLTANRYTPGINDTEVPVDSSVTLEFNIDIFEGELYDSIAFVDSDGNEVAFTKTIEDYKLILDPAELLNHGEIYVVSIPVNAVIGYDGSVMKEDFLITFTTEKIYPYPVVKFVYPFDRMGSVPVNSDINIRFSGSIKAGSEYAGINLKDSAGQEVGLNKSIDNDMLKLDPVTYLDENTVYFVTIPFGAISYMNGIPTEDEYTFSFTTVTETGSEPEPEPDPDPEPEPDPDPEPEPEPDPDPDPEPEPEPTPQPEPNPDPEPEPTPQPEPNPDPEEDEAGIGGSNDETVSVTITAEAEMSDSTDVIKAAVDKDMIEAALSEIIDESEGRAGAKTEIAIDLNAKDAIEASLQIQRDAFDKIAEASGVALTLNIGIATVKYDEQTVDYISNTGNAGDISLSIKRADPDTLTQEAKDKIGDRPVVDLRIKAGEKEITSFGGGKVSVSIPYIPRADEKNYAILVYVIDNGGRLIPTMGQYDPVSKAVEFTTTHFSQYAVGYNEVTFDDVGENLWYSEAIGFLAAREVINGFGNGKFTPGGNITRADFLIMVMKAYGIEVDSTVTDNFADAGSKYYTPYLGTAKRLGLITGVGNNMYDPEAAVSRQDMAVILYRILDSIGRLPSEKGDNTLEDFGDVENISEYAMDALKLYIETGVINGDGKNLNPKDTSTRAQAAQILYNLQR